MDWNLYLNLSKKRDGIRSVFNRKENEFEREREKKESV